VYEEELLVGERYVLTIQVIGKVTIDGWEAPLEFLLKGGGYDNEYGVEVGRGLSGAQHVVGCKNSDVVLVEDGLACVALQFHLSFQVEADGHKRGGERLVVCGQMVYVVEYHQSVFVYHVGFCCYGVLLFHIL
jgi:hypothetical protein